MLIGVRIEIFVSDITQLLNLVEYSINWCIDIKNLLFGHILNLDNNLTCDFTINIEGMIEDDVDRPLGGFAQGRNVLCIGGCNDLLT